MNLRQLVKQFLHHFFFSDQPDKKLIVAKYPLAQLEKEAPIIGGNGIIRLLV
jgi:hypothetical protein